VTVCGCAVESEPLKFESPAYVAVMVCDPVEE
jgi:hypothetical protein